MKTVLTIAGSDSGGGAGIQADLKAISAQGVFGMSVITAITAQNTVEVREVQNIDLAMIRSQIEAVFDDIQVDTVKIGMLSSAGVVQIVAKTLREYAPKQIILDPVMISKAGHHLLQEEAIDALKDMLIPMSTMITPNVPEAEVLTGREIKTKEDMKLACREIHRQGAKTVLLKGGHLEGDPDDLFFDGENDYWYEEKRIETKNTHGTGCTLSSAIAANLAKGDSLIDAVSSSKRYITNAIKYSLDLGRGHGPVHHFYEFHKSTAMKEKEGSVIG